jgi:hypothetical protein
MPYSQSWLEDPSAMRIILVDATVYDIAAGQNVNLYLSTGGYTTTDGLAAFLPIIAKRPTLTESLSKDGNSAGMTFGDIEIHNLNGELDKYLDSTRYIWSNKSIKIYFGDPGWTSTLANLAVEFLTIFNGIVDDIDSRSLRSLNLKLRDKLERLNAPISENKLGTYGTWPGGQKNQDQMRPLIFGEVFNVTPLLINPVTQEYMVTTGSASQLTGLTGEGDVCERIIEIRDNGVPIYGTVGAASIIKGASYKILTVGTTNWTAVGAASNTVGVSFRATGNSSGTGTATIVDTITSTGSLSSTPVVDPTNTGTFKLAAPPAGVITATVQGVKKSTNLTTGAAQTTYVNTVANIIATIVTQFGKSSTRLTASDVDWTNFNAFNTTNSTQEVGLYLDNTENVLIACQQVASSIGSQIVMSRTGKLQIYQFGTTNPSSYTEVGTDDIIYNSFSITNRLNAQAGVKLAFAKNYTVQSDLLTAIPISNKQNLATEWMTITGVDGTVKTNYSLDADPLQREVLLISDTDAVTEATRLLTYYKSVRTVYKFTGKSRLLSLTLGSTIRLTYPRFNLTAGSLGQVVSLTPDWLSGTVEVEVIV